MSQSVEEKLDAYSEIFDNYIEIGRLHPSVEDDVLAQYIKTALDDEEVKEKYLKGQIWCERLKASLLDFFRALLEEIEMYEKRKEAELIYIESFLNADINMKRYMWKEMTDYVRKSYSLEEINVDGYELLLRESDIAKDDIFECIANDWRNAACKRYDDLLERISDFNKGRLKQRIRGLRGISDFKLVEDVETVIYKYPALLEIAKIMGRKEDVKDSELDSVVTRNVPFLLSHSHIREEIDGVVLGDNLAAMLPLETVLLDCAETESIFYKKYVTKQLQLIHGKSQTTKKEKDDKVKNQHRQQKGPMIVSVDTSGSMYGEPESIAKSLLMSILDVAKREKRNCFLITYSVRAKALDISKPYHWTQLMKFLRENFSGGTDGEEMLKCITATLDTQEYSMADVLIISDFDFSYPCKKTHDAIAATKEKGTKYYALSIGDDIKREKKFMELFDNVWYV